MVAILPGHSCSGYHTPHERLQACFQQLSLTATWLITSNPTTSDLRSSVHFCNQRTLLSLRRNPGSPCLTYTLENTNPTLHAGSLSSSGYIFYSMGRFIAVSLTFLAPTWSCRRGRKKMEVTLLPDASKNSEVTCTPAHLSGRRKGEKNERYLQHAIIILLWRVIIIH